MNCTNLTKKFLAFLSAFLFLFAGFLFPISVSAESPDSELSSGTDTLESENNTGQEIQQPEGDILPEEDVLPEKDVLPEEEMLLTDDTQEFTEEMLISQPENPDLTAGGIPVIYEDGLHYVKDDPEYPNDTILLYCMNNKLHWPHLTPDMGDASVPNYEEGYLTPDDFDTPGDYDECMRRLSKILYAGFPYNGERLYKIVDSAENYTPSVEEFNEMLVVPPILQTAFPVLGHHDFLYSDYQNQDTSATAKEHIEELRKFINEVAALSQGGSTSNGLVYNEITVMPFYKAAWCMVYGRDPLFVYANFYSASYFVTKEQAYNATQDAVWYLLHEYGIPDNDITSLGHTELGRIFYLYSERGGLLEEEPSVNDIHLKGDLKFTYNPKDGRWHSSPLQIIEPEAYNGLYRLSLPEGWTALCDNLNYVYGNEEYELVADKQPQDGQTFGIKAEFIWLKDMKQYTPSPDTEVNGKKFQHMIGAVIRNKTISASIPVGHTDVGSLSITKKTEYDEDSQNVFHFTLQLPYHTEINGQYGDLQFRKGIAEFSLRSGETLTATHLPSGAEYKITEEESGEYLVSSLNDHGTVIVDDIKEVTFTNTRLHDLILSKTVTGDIGDKQKLFSFTIELKDKNGHPVSGEYPYRGSVKEVLEGEASAPPDGILHFENGKAEISLSHGQQITIDNLHPKTSYIITESDASTDGYITSYPNGQQDKAEGNLNTDAAVHIINDKSSAPDTGLDDFSKTAGPLILTGSAGFLLLTAEVFFRSRKGHKK